MANRQVKVTLDEVTFSVIDRLAVVTGFSRSAVVASLLRPNIDTLSATAGVLEKASELQGNMSVDVGKVLRNVFELVEHQVTQKRNDDEIASCVEKMRSKKEADTVNHCPATASDVPDVFSDEDELEYLDGLDDDEIFEIQRLRGS